MIERKSTSEEERKQTEEREKAVSPHRQEPEENKPLFCPTGYPDHGLYEAVVAYNGCAVYMRRQAMHARVKY